MPLVYHPSLCRLKQRSYSLQVDGSCFPRSVEQWTASSCHRYGMSIEQIYYRMLSLFSCMRPNCCSTLTEFFGELCPLLRNVFYEPSALSPQGRGVLRGRGMPLVRKPAFSTLRVYSEGNEREPTQELNAWSSAPAPLAGNAHLAHQGERADRLRLLGELSAQGVTRDRDRTPSRDGRTNGALLA